MDRNDAKRQVIRAGRELSDSGLIARTWGNVSRRLDEASFAVTASGRNYRTLTEREVVVVNMEDLSYSGDFAPSSEMKIHRAVYEKKSDARFVIHTHQDNASAISAMGTDRIVLDRIYPGLGNSVLCAEYGLPGTERLCQNTRKTLDACQANAVILRQHGALCWGRDYDEAFETARQLEKACGEYLKKLDKRIISENKGDTKQLGKTTIWNRSRILLDFAEEAKVMRPYLDDFAQLAGLKIQVIPRNREMAERAVRRGSSVLVKGIGAFCTAGSLEDAKALSMIIEKNAMAFFAARAGGGKPLSRRDSRKMRRNYIRNYSKLAEMDR